MNIIKGDILYAPEQVLIQQVNDLGIMGAGLALQIKNKYPEVYEKYKYTCNKYNDLLGKVQFAGANDKRIICNMFSQRGISRTKQTTDYKLMEECLKKITKFVEDNQLEVAIPYKIGCGLAGGDWEIVSKLIDKYLPNATIYRKEWEDE